MRHHNHSYCSGTEHRTRSSHPKHASLSLPSTQIYLCSGNVLNIAPLDCSLIHLVVWLDQVLQSYLIAPWVMYIYTLRVNPNSSGLTEGQHSQCYKAILNSSSLSKHLKYKQNTSEPLLICLSIEIIPKREFKRVFLLPIFRQWQLSKFMKETWYCTCSLVN